MNDTLLSIQNLHIKYITGEDVVSAVNGIDFELKKGEILGLVGETGAGKTTTALSILRLLPKYVGKVPEGSIVFDGIDLLAASEADMRDIRGKRISMIFQDPMTSLNPVYDVGNQIGEVIKLHEPELSKEQVEDKVDRILETVGIPAARKSEYPHQFSGGMKQRVMIAIAIACQPELLIADEPTTALDVTIQAQVLRMMRDLQKELNSSVIMITHDLGIVAHFCDTVAIIYAGEIVEYGTLQDVFDKRRKHHPYTTGLFNSIPDIHSAAKRLQPITGLMPDPSDLPSGCKFHPRCPHCMDCCREGEVFNYQLDTHKVRCNLFGEAVDYE